MPAKKTEHARRLKRSLGKRNWFKNKEKDNITKENNHNKKRNKINIDVIVQFFTGE